jgi:hypothetical protein
MDAWTALALSRQTMCELRRDARHRLAKSVTAAERTRRTTR